MHQLPAPENRDCGVDGSRLMASAGQTAVWVWFHTAKCWFFRSPPKRTWEPGTRDKMRRQTKNASPYSMLTVRKRFGKSPSRNEKIFENNPPAVPTGFDKNYPPVRPFDPRLSPVETSSQRLIATETLNFPARPGTGGRRYSHDPTWNRKVAGCCPRSRSRTLGFVPKIGRLQQAFKIS